MSEVRTPIHGAIQASAADDEDLEGAVLTGWVLVAEWMDAAGDRWFSRLDGGGADGRSTPASWTTEGLLRAGIRSLIASEDDA